jgi:alkylation response protein AidB-like acyl-CoA dehydrogenase
MDLRDTPAEAAFRHELREWLADRLAGRPGRPDGPIQAGPDAAASWTTELHRAGYTGLTWPVEYGGRGLPIAYSAIYLDETARAGAPEHIGVIGLGVVGPTLIAHGTPAQKTHHLPRILSGETLFCQGFSEPEAGSDLAALRTFAHPCGDGSYEITGHKVWSSYAHVANWCLLLARTDAASTRHRGLTCFMLDMSGPGVAVRPMRQLSGAADFNEIVLSRAHVSAAAVVGAPGDGWRVAMTGLANERGSLGFTLAARLAAQFERLLVTARAYGRMDDPLVADRIAALAVEVDALRWTSYRLLCNRDAGDQPGPESSIVKLRWSEANQRLTTLAVELLGPDAPLDGADGFWNGFWQYQQLRSRGNSIEGGTSEIQRNVIAERLLGLPRSR